MKKLLIIAILAYCLPFTSCKKACEKDLTGTICVQNTTFELVMVTMNGGFPEFLDAGTTACYEVSAGLLNLEIEPSNLNPPTQESLNIPACGTISYTYQ